jgi:hypothetical protein
MAEALLHMLERNTTGYSEEGQAVSRFYDLLEAAVLLQPDGPASGGCKGCGKEEVVE